MEVVNDDGRCMREEPALFAAGPGHRSRCFLVDQGKLGILRATDGKESA